MTVKRFTVEGLGDIGEYLRDNQIKKNTVDLSLMADWLNSLNDENEQLRTKNNAYIQDIEVFKEENTHLKLENEQLREELKIKTNENERLVKLMEHIL